jgi:hypothetical protein
MGIYNGVWENLYRRIMKREPDPLEQTKLLPSYEDANRRTPGMSNPSSGNGGYGATDKDAVNE